MSAPTAPNAEPETPLGTPTTPDEAHAIGRFLPAGLDGLRKMFAQTVERCDRDITFMRASQRWRPGQADPESYVPGDVPAMRATLAGTNVNLPALTDGASGACSQVTLLPCGRRSWPSRVPQ